VWRAANNLAPPIARSNEFGKTLTGMGLVAPVKVDGLAHLASGTSFPMMKTNLRFSADQKDRAWAYKINWPLLAAAVTSMSEPLQ
jgi:hypothetical protein